MEVQNLPKVVEKNDFHRILSGIIEKSEMDDESSFEGVTPQKIKTKKSWSLHRNVVTWRQNKAQMLENATGPQGCKCL